MHDTEFLNSMKEKLLAEKKRLEDELSRLGKKSADGTTYQTSWEEYGSGEEDNAAEVAAFGDSLGLTATLDAEYKSVLDALDRLEKGAYGVCAECGVQIAPERLTARPASILCVACQSKNERA